MHSYYVARGIDGAVMQKQAWDRLTDRRSPEDSIVHAHAHLSACNQKCIRYHTCVTTGEPGSHSITEACPEKEEQDA